MSSNRAWRLFLNRQSLLALLFVVIQQLIVASSTLWIANLSSAVVNNGKIYLWLSLFVASLVTVFLPEMMINLCAERARYLSFKTYAGWFESSFRGRAFLRSNVAERNAIQPFLNNEAWFVIDHSYAFFTDLVAAAINVAFNVIMLGFVIDRKFIVAYLISIPIFALILVFARHRSESLAAAAQTARTSLMQSLLPGWDTFLINNKLNSDMWHREFSKNYDNSLKATSSSVLFVGLIFNISVFMAVSPVLVALFMVFWKSRLDPEMLVLLIATLPRQVQIIQHISVVISYSVKWHTVKAKIAGLISVLRSDGSHTTSKIQWNEISFHGLAQPVSNFEDLLKQIAPATCTRITVRGRNGSGKSSILNKLKDAFAEKALLLPASSELLFPSTVNRTFSSGEKIKVALGDLCALDDVSFFLLDEWDANLDTDKSREISRQIDELARRKCVIEVRHRTE